jgi:ribonuclease J
MAKSRKNILSVIPLGGVSEIGKNMLVLECNNDIIVIDAGLKFPTEELPGVDLVIPNIAYLKNNREKVRGIILTHGHEDHVGALPFVLDEIKVPVYGTQLTIGIAGTKLMDRKKLDKSDYSLNVISPEDTLQLGCFKINFFRVNHSIPDGVGLAIETPAGLVVHSGDFKIDQTPVDGRVMELNKVAHNGDRGVLLFICDTTNVERPGYTQSETLVGETLKNIFEQSERRIIVTTFASNVHRLQQIIDAAVAYGRKVALAGRSMLNIAGVALELGYLQAPPDVILEVDEANKLPPEKVVIITTGSQGEPAAALTRMSQGSHRQVNIMAGDTVIISASPIPGNERLIARTIDNLFRLGARVVYKVDGTVHVSGHASVEEIKIMINLLRPKYVLPFHGEYRHKVHFANLAASMGIPEDHVIMAEIGERWEFQKQEASLGGKVAAGELMVDGLGIGDVGSVVLQDRQNLSENGVVVVALGFDSTTGALISGPEIYSRGFIYIKENMEIVHEAKRVISKMLARMEKRQLDDRSYLKKCITKSLSAFIYKKIGRDPMILPIIIEYGKN